MARFGNLTFRIIEEEDHTDVWNFMLREYFPREPNCATFNFTPEQANMFIGDLIRDSVWQCSSLGAYNKQANDLVGIWMGLLGKKPRKYHSLDDEGYPLPVRQAIQLMIHMLPQEPEELLGTKDFMQFVALCTRCDQSNSGIAAELCRRAEDNARAEGCKKILTIASSAYSLKICKRLGFKIKKEVFYKDYVDPFTGKKLYENMSSPHEKVALVVKDLE